MNGPAQRAPAPPALATEGQDPAHADLRRAVLRRRACGVRARPSATSRAILPTSPTRGRESAASELKAPGTWRNSVRRYSMTGTSLCEQARTRPTTRGPSRACRRSRTRWPSCSASGRSASGVMTFASGGLGWYISGRVLRPVREITETARRASEQHLGERLALTGPRDELRELGDTFDDMLERLDGAFAAQGRFVANASHELRTPLTVMRTAIDVTLAKPVPDGAAAYGHGRAGAALDRPGRGHDRGAAHPGGQRPGQAQHRVQADLATWAEDAIDIAAPEIERLNLHRGGEARPGRDDRRSAAA